MTPRILFVINSLAGGGAERVLTTLLEASHDRRDRYRMALALLDEDPSTYAAPDWMPVHRLDCRRSLARSLARLWTLVGRTRPDVALSFLTRSNVATAVAMGMRRRPFILSERVNTTAHLSTGRHARTSMRLVRWSYPHASRVIAVSEGVADTLVEDYRVARQKVDVIYNPVDLDRIAARCREEPVIEVRPDDAVAMGRLTQNKNFELAIRAFAGSERPGRLLLLGEGEERRRLRGLGDELGLGERLVMPGFVRNPHAIIARAACFLLSSNAEGFSNALVEAMACDVPVVATDCPSSPLQILDVAKRPAPGRFETGAGGLLVPVQDEKAMILAIRALSDPGRRDRLAEAGRVRVQEFSVARAVDRYWDVIDSVLAQRPRQDAPLGQPMQHATS